eukprot:1537477-Ditylum_brightwellii.AAC.1
MRELSLFKGLTKIRAWWGGMNINSQDTKKVDREDERLLAYIRQINLDILWSKSKNTVRSDLTGMQRGLWMTDKLSIPPPYLPRGPWPIGDELGFRVALQTEVCLQQLTDEFTSDSLGKFKIPGV